MLAFPLSVSISGLDDEIIYRAKSTATFLSLDIFEFLSLIQRLGKGHLARLPGVFNKIYVYDFSGSDKEEKLVWQYILKMGSL